MTDSDETSDLAVDGDSPTVLRVPAVTDRLALVRGLVETALYIDDWSLDEVIDAKVAVDEICSQIIAAAADGSSIEITLHLSADGILGEVRGELVQGVALNQSTFGWRIVQTVTDTHTISYGEPLSGAGDKARPVTIRFSKFRR
ncbi:anti-sigma factor [Gordonia sp. zg691]|uniref:Anti-sigma factor n=1 Tax=Gordonia jinghuaiqii TaxID=2758710 RepID=A0A7D7LXG0_9ACTN|nr:anti-sigma factor [Gordonia jinghuaiqii]MBD0863617.1 anti-sigma factor [Gordonia jinghuaiqii]MCR5979353.1 anti-sigma factor [Gordonia jinghuaiqii]QMT01136.1 anti-sigma factor [Gordonia jinghuaiqii]